MGTEVVLTFSHNYVCNVHKGHLKGYKQAVLHILHPEFCSHDAFKPILTPAEVF